MKGIGATVTGSFLWDGVSTMTGGGTTVVGPDATATLAGSGDRNLDNRTLAVDGTLLHQDDCRIVLYSASRLENRENGVIELQSDAVWVNGGGSPSSISNAGLIKKTAGSAEAASIA